MSETKVFLLPDLGEGLTEAELVNWLVAVGDEIRVDQPIAEVETAKSVVEVPSPYAGTVAELHGEPGQTLDVGKPLISVTPLVEPVETEPAESKSRWLSLSKPLSNPKPQKPQQQKPTAQKKKQAPATSSSGMERLAVLQRSAEPVPDVPPRFRQAQPAARLRATLSRPREAK
jgi:pyruvate/2-oxoglutarate dehydrogenase complex dihydrolipoamide acyltransferase (E2) component